MSTRGSELSGPPDSPSSPISQSERFLLKDNPQQLPFCPSPLSSSSTTAQRRRRRRGFVLSPASCAPHGALTSTHLLSQSLAEVTDDITVTSSDLTHVHRGTSQNCVYAKSYSLGNISGFFSFSGHLCIPALPQAFDQHAFVWLPPFNALFLKKKDGLRCYEAVSDGGERGSEKKPPTPFNGSLFITARIHISEEKEFGGSRRCEESDTFSVSAD
ncbi:hypothetical protein F2P81_015796 [Scophthalmus maximus]|uniref:Uncharacterized protein n=1 Tax=Scophthalmus maximus TaxID=52904 RepID=A0A6A4SJD6_SCOMX|nr:hypothetical protein F2P81_015796 [Scophthalmus maximus]